MMLDQKDYESWDSWSLYGEIIRADRIVENYPDHEKTPLWKGMRDHIYGILDQRSDTL